MESAAAELSPAASSPRLARGLPGRVPCVQQGVADRGDDVAVPRIARGGPAAAQKGTLMDEATCATCPWWSRFPERVEFRMGDDGTQMELRTPNDKGECRKLPPLFERTFPISRIDDWCGEHPDRTLSRPGATG